MLRALTILMLLLAAALPVMAQDDIDCDAEAHDAEFYYDRGWDYYREARYLLAVPYFSCALEIDPSYDDAQHMRGLMYELSADYEDALADYTAVVERSPDYRISYIGIGNVHLSLEQYEEALDAFTSYIKLDDQNSNIFYNRAIVYYLLEDYEAALSDYSKSINLNPNFADAYAGRSRAYAVLGDYASAVLDAKTAVELDPDTKGWLYAALAEAYTGVERYEEARGAYDIYLRLVDEEDYDARVLEDMARLDERLAQIRNECYVNAFPANANRRRRPSLDATVLGVLQPGSQARVITRRIDDQGFIWWQLADDGGWVRSDAVLEIGACNRVDDVTP